VTARFHTLVSAQQLEMDTLGGVIQRPRERLYSPTFWPVPSRLTLRDARVLHVLFESTSAASLGADGALEWIVARNAPKERAFGWLPVLAHPIGGSNPDLQVHEAALLMDGAALAQSRAALERAWATSALEEQAVRSALSLVRCDNPAVAVAALKRGSTQDALTLRLFCEEVPEAPVRLWLDRVNVRRAFACDALDRPLSPLVVEDSGCVVVPVARRLTSLQLSR
jgi:hypothetical protein